MFGKLGLDYYVTNRATISLGLIKVHGQFNPNETINATTDSLLLFRYKKRQQRALYFGHTII